MIWSIDRFEGDLAVCISENGAVRNLSRDRLPCGVREGDMVAEEDGGYRLEPEATVQRREAARRPRMSASARRRAIERALSDSEPVSASALAQRFSVSRKIVVGDIALLRAGGVPVVATPRGYLLRRNGEDGLVFTVACRHHSASIRDEFYAIVDNGGTVLDVIVEHPVYGQLTGQLQIFSRYDADRFAEQLAASNAPPLSALTDGVHLHTLRCRDESARERICTALRTAGILFEQEG